MRKLYITALNFEVGHVLETGKGLQLAMALTAMKWNEIIDLIGSELQMADWNALLIGDM